MWVVLLWYDSTNVRNYIVLFVQLSYESKMLTVDKVFDGTTLVQPQNAYNYICLVVRL